MIATNDTVLILYCWTLLQVGQQQPQPQDDRHEPLYAKVNKHQRPQEHMMLEQPPQEGAGGADSWV